MKRSTGNGNGKKNGSKLTPQQLAVIVGLLTNVLEVNSVLIDKDQKIEIWFNYDDWFGNGKPNLSSKLNFDRFVSIKSI